MLSEEEIAINRLECGNTAHSRNADYIQLAIKALKKQVPMKPKFYNCNYYCDECGDRAEDLVLYQDEDGTQLCLDCLLEKYEKVEV